MPSKLTVLSLAILLLPGCVARQMGLAWTVEIENGEQARGSSPVSLELQAVGNFRAELWSKGALLDRPVQIDREEDGLRAQWIHPAMAAGERQQVELRLMPLAAAVESEQPAPIGESGGQDLRVGGSPVARYMYGFDPQRREETYKVFHHVYDSSGEDFLTKGSGGQFSHHRGLFLGFNQMEVGGRKMDFWHCHEDLRIVHREFLAGQEGRIKSTAGYRIHWVDGEGSAIVEEERWLRAWRVSASRQILDFEIFLRSMAAATRLAGDAQHAGFQFRAKEAKAGEPDLQLTYLRQEGAVARGNDVWVDCSWVAGFFEQNGRRYAVVHMDSESNPRPNRYSTREYGRFGSTFDADLGEEVLGLRYRILIIDVDAEAAPTVADLQADYRSYVEPLAIRVTGN